MAAPGFFILLAGILLLAFAACMLTGAVWLFVGWRKKSRSVQILSALPFGVGLLIIGPLLFLALIMVGWWLIADWRRIPPPAQEQNKPNQRAGGDGGMAVLLHVGRAGPAAPRHDRSERGMLRIFLSMVLSLCVTGCGGNYTLDQKSFSAEELKMVEQRTGIALPTGSQGLNMFYKGEPMDPYFVANIEIPENALKDLRTRIEQIRNEEIHVSGSPTGRFAWWKASKETTKVERQFHVKPDYYVHLVLCEESGRWILYVEWGV